jgi:hypothetical protein
MRNRALLFLFFLLCLLPMTPRAADQDAGHSSEQTSGQASGQTSGPPGGNGVLQLAPLQGGAPSPFAIPDKEGHDLDVDASVCASMAGHEDKGLEGFKNHLVEQARQEAARLLVARLYAGKIDSPLQRTLPTEYHDALSRRMDLRSKPQFYNGTVFGELCVRIQAGIDSGALPTSAPVAATLENFCFQAPDLTEDELVFKSKQAALERIVQNVAPGARIPGVLRAQLLDSAEVSGQLGGLGQDTYCLNMRLIIAPLELESFIPHKTTKEADAPPKGETLADLEKPAYSLDLSKHAPGDLAPELGDNLRVYHDAEGKSLGPVDRQPAMAILPLTSERDFILRVLLRKALQLDYVHEATIDLFRVHFSNKTYEPFEFIMHLDEARRPVAYFRTRHDSTDVLPWENATNFNDCLVVKRGKRINFFFNGDFVFSYPTEGDMLTEIRVPLSWGDRLYNVLLKND